MNRSELIANGFNEYPVPLIGNNTHADGFYQKRIRDEIGTQYFINCFEYTGENSTWEVEITYGEGCLWSLDCAMEIRAFGSLKDWSIGELLAWAERLWELLEPHYYECEPTPPRAGEETGT